MAVRIWSIALQGFKEPILIESDVETSIMLIHNAYSLVKSREVTSSKHTSSFQFFVVKT